MYASFFRAPARCSNRSCRKSATTAPAAASLAPVVQRHVQQPSPACAPVSSAAASQLSSMYPRASPASSCSSGTSSRRRQQPHHHRCQAARTQAGPVDEAKEAHKIFDEAVITVRSGKGGDGEIVEAGRGKWVNNLKYHAGANQPKKLWLPASDPADGADGADIAIVCDPSLDTLLHLHKRKEWAGRRGGQGNPAVGSAGPKRNQEVKKAITPPLEIPVPPGTVVKRKGTGQVLGEVLQPGERLLVAHGGKGGRGVVAPSRMQKQQELRKEFKRAQKAGAEVVAIEDTNWKEDAKGLPGQQMSLQLLLRVVADVGLVGFPNAGKSSLLAALTRASPEVAPYPFTTLMPNLGVLAAGGQGPVLADLPGLIEGAHLGKGLGRMFLRHLRRTRLLLQVVDASAADPGTDYLAVREELRMYNPDYVSRPHVVALNKVDLEDAGGLVQEITDEVKAAAAQLQATHADDVPGLTAPAAIVACSALTGEGLQELAVALQSVLQEMYSDSGGRPIAQHVGRELEQQQQERLQQRRQQLLQQGEQLRQQEQAEQQQRQRADDAGVAATVSAALGVSTAAAAAAAAADGSEGSEQDGGEAGWGEEGEEEEGEWDDLDEDTLAAIAAALENEEGAGDEEEEHEEEAPPAPLPAGDPDAWLLELSEEELLKLADEAE